MGGPLACQEDGGSSSYKQALKVEGSLGACVWAGWRGVLYVEDSLGARVWAGWRGVSVCESECECLSCCLSPALFTFLSPRSEMLRNLKNLSHVLWGLNWVLELDCSAPYRRFIGHTWKQAPDYESECNWVQLDKSMDVLSTLKLLAFNSKSLILD